MWKTSVWWISIRMWKWNIKTTETSLDNKIAIIENNSHIDTISLIIICMMLLVFVSLSIGQDIRKKQYLLPYHSTPVTNEKKPILII